MDVKVEGVNTEEAVARARALELQGIVEQCTGIAQRLGIVNK